MKNHEYYDFIMSPDKSLILLLFMLNFVYILKLYMTISHESRISIESKQENKEELELPPVFIIYRENDLFTQQIPYFVEALGSGGRKVEVKIFPSRTEEKYIAEWAKNNEDLLKNHEVIIDRTFYRSIKEAGVFSEDDRKHFTKSNFPDLDKKETGRISDVKFSDRLLDSLSDRVAYWAIFEKPIEVSSTNMYGKVTKQLVEPEDFTSIEANTLEDNKMLYSLLFSKILSNKENHPKKIFISLDHIMDHINFSEFKDESGDTREDSGILFANTLKEWLKNNGIEENQISILEEGSNIQQSDEDNNWLIIDRHVWSSEESKKRVITKAKILGLPFSDFVKDAYDEKILSLTEDSIKAGWENIAKGKFLLKKE